MTSVFILLFVTIQRVSELIIARYNTHNLMLRGAIEMGQNHYPYMVALHTGWMLGLWYFAYALPANTPLLLLYSALQLVRVYIMLSLGSRWTTRIIVIPGAPLVRRGLYRYIKHPNYCLVVIEIALLPMVFGLYKFAIVFSVLNALMLTVRIKAENAALHQN